jgi:hypothetical protein
MCTRTLRNPSLILVAALAAAALTIDWASARGGGGSRGGGASVRAFTGSTAVRAAPTMHGLQGLPMRVPQQSTRAVGAVAPTSSLPSAVSIAPKSADPPASKAGALLLLLNSDLSAPPTPPPPVLAAPPMPAVSAPEGQIQPVAPLSEPIATTNVGTGRAVTATTVSPYFSYSTPESPSQVAPSLPGGGGGTLEDCMGFWDRATHMTKNEWKAACQRTLHRLDDVAKEFAREPTPAKPSR